MALEDLKAQIEQTIAEIPTKAARARMTSELEILHAAYNATGATAAEQEEARIRLNQLQRDAEAASQVTLWDLFAPIVILLVLAAYLVGIWLYLKGLGSPRYAGVEATRAILVFTLIVAMLGFGGLLMVRALYDKGTADELRERFRNAREVFVTFAGVFSTIIGFYFGTSTTAPADPPFLGVPSFAAGKVTASVRGGREPLEGRIRLAPTAGSQPMIVSGRTLSYTVGGSGACPVGAVIEVIDADVRRNTADLDCPGGESADGAAANNMSATNAAAGNNS
jgi:hypothetical protein